MNIRKAGIIVIAALGVVAASASYAQSPGTPQPRKSNQAVERDAENTNRRKQTDINMRLQAEERRRQAETRRAEEEARRVEAEASSRDEEARAERERSAETPAEQPPNEHPASAALLPEEDAQNAELREQHKDMREENRDDRGPVDDGGDDD